MDHGTMGLEQVERLGRHGVAPEAILLSHCDRNHDAAYHADLAATGAYLVYDGPSRTKYHSPEFVAGLIAAACAAGAQQRILLGMDLALRSYRVGYGGSPGMGFLPGCFVDVLRGHGFGDDAVAAFTVTNPAGALALRGTA
jgi:phosphotriesterase-related protein